MVEFFRRALRLVQKDPVVVVPVLLSALLAFVLNTGSGFLIETGLRSWAARSATPQSVLLGNPGGGHVLSQSAMTSLVSLARALQAFVGKLLLAAALYATIRMVQHFLEHRTGPRKLAPWPFNAIARLACWMFGIDLLTSLLLVYVWNAAPITRHLNGRWETLEVLSQLLVSAWFVAPHIVRFVAAQTGAATPALRGRVVVVLATVISTGITFAANALIFKAFNFKAFSNPDQAHAGILLTARAVQSLLVAVPTTIAFTMLTLVALRGRTADGSEIPD